MSLDKLGVVSDIPQGVVCDVGKWHGNVFLLGNLAGWDIPTQ